MPPAPKPFVFDLTPAEVAELEPPSGEGGHQGLHEMLRNQVKQTGNRITLNDAQLGQLIRYMTQYGQGGFQGRLRRAFIRPLGDLLGF